MQVNVIVPEGVKFCPYLPPVPVINKTALGASQATMHLTPCAGTACAVWDACQGNESAGKHNGRVRRSISKLITFLGAKFFMPTDEITDALKELDSEAEAKA